MTCRSFVWHRSRTGVPGLRRPQAALMAATIVAGFVAAVVGPVLPSGHPPTDPPYPVARLVLATCLMGAAQLARQRVRLALVVVSVTWTEAAVVVCLHLVPATWLPAVTFVGAGLGWFLLSAFDGRRGEGVAVAATLSVAVTPAAAVAVWLHEPYHAALTPPLVGALAVGAVAYLLAAAGLAALSLRVCRGLPVGRTVLDILRGKLPVFVGNLAVSLVAVALLDHDVRWLPLLLPLVWLLWLAYRQRLQAANERRTWLDYAQAVKALNQPDERAVATAGAVGALKVLDARHVDLDVVRNDGGRQRYHADASGTAPDDHPPDRWQEETTELVRRPLTVAGEPVGELRLWLPRGAALGTCEAAVLSAYAEALAAALRNAAHRHQLTRAAEARHAATRDPLTQLLNRAALLDQGEVALRRVDRDRAVVLAVIDIDNFTEVNETLGHAAGDELLRLTADRLRGVARRDEMIGRIGDDEFALLATAVPAVIAPPRSKHRPALIPYALRRARQIADLLSAAVEVAGVRMSAEVSVGVACMEAGAANLAELLRRAEVAMRQAKKKGGVACYDGAGDAANTDHLTVLAEMREALAVDDQLVLALQPAIDLATGVPTGVEALIRWRHPRRGELNPTDFIPIVENSDLLAPFTRYVIDKALAIAADWVRHGLAVPISVNLCARSLLDPRLPAEVAELLRHHRVPPQRLVLEITESVEVSDLEVIDEVLAALQTLGVQLAVDDFGTGFSSLAFLTRVTVNELKVDRSFVMRMGESAEAAAIVRATVALGRELGLRVVAEGVETAEQRRVLAALGCAAAQGYHFFKPMPSDEATAVLRSLLDSAAVLPLSAENT